MTLTGTGLLRLQTALHEGADEASDALGRWIGRPARVTFDALAQLALGEATNVLGASDEPICCCVTDMTGRLTGHLILAFDDASGLALGDLLLGQAEGTSTEWTDLVTSAALETTNIVGCAYLNAMVRALPADPDGVAELIPSPPRFIRDFAESVLQFALMDQIVMSDEVLLAHTTFQIDETPLDWTLLFVPDAQSMAKLNVEAP